MYPSPRSVCLVRGTQRGAVDAPPCACFEAHETEERVWECTGDPMGSPLRTRLVAARVTLRSRDPVEVRVRDGVLPEEEAQLGSMFLDVAHIVELQLQKADWPPLRPGIRDGPARLLVRQRDQRGVALLARGREIGAQLLLGIGPCGQRPYGIALPLGKGGRGSKFLLREAREAQDSPANRIKGTYQTSASSGGDHRQC